MTTLILPYLKDLLSVSSDLTSFDSEIVMAANSAFTTLNQLGVGPTPAYSISVSGNQTWEDFFGTIPVNEFVKSYVYAKTRLLFDPPTSGILMDSLSRTISELEFRLSIS